VGYSVVALDHPCVIVLTQINQTSTTDLANPGWHVTRLSVNFLDPTLELAIGLDRSLDHPVTTDDLVVEGVVNCVHN
jgi:hypothetical protein